MCTIVDACVATRVLLVQDDPDFSLIRQFLLSKKLQLVYGGKLREEYLAMAAVAKFLHILDQAGIAKAIPDADVDADVLVVMKLGLCQSNDAHIIALARVSGARLLCSLDQALHQDFTNPRLLNRPRGKVFQGVAHKKLLRRRCKRCGKSG